MRFLSTPGLQNIKHLLQDVVPNTELLWKCHDLPFNYSCRASEPDQKFSAQNSSDKSGFRNFANAK